MRVGFAALAALMIGALGAHFLLQERGYVLVSFGAWTIEMSVPILVLLLVLLYLAVRLLLRLWQAPRDLGAAVAEHRDRRAANRLTRGLIHMTEGDWTRSERLLTDGLDSRQSPLVNYLMAARAAHLQGARERRNEWLKLAFERVPEAEATVLITQGELQFEDGEYEHALASVQRVLDTEPGHPAATALLADISIALGDSERLVELLPALAKAGIAPPRFVEFATAALTALLARADLAEDDYRRVWNALPGGVRRNPAVIRMQALILDRLGKSDEAVKVLSAGLKRDWRPELVRAFGEVKATDPARQLQRAESWLAGHPDDATLLQTTARLCIANELWGKARSYLESSIALAPEPAAYSLYGQLLEKLGERDKAAIAFHSGLSQVTGIDFAQPALEAKPGTLGDA